MISTYKRIILLCFMASCQWAAVNSQSWPTPKPEAKAGTRWWWLGSAVDKTNLQWNLSEYARVDRYYHHYRDRTARLSSGHSVRKPCGVSV